MDQLIRILFALFLAVGITASGVRPPVQIPMDCCAVDEDGSCPCGMPMPEKGPQPCGSAMPAPVATPTRAVTIVVGQALAADLAVHEPKPWPAAWTLVPRFGDETQRSAEPVPVDTGPPLLASERSAYLRVFRI